MVTRSRSGGQKPFFLTPSKLVQLDGHIDTPTSSCTSPPDDNGPEPELESEPEPEPEPEHDLDLKLDLNLNLYPTLSLCSGLNMIV